MTATSSSQVSVENSFKKPNKNRQYAFMQKVFPVMETKNESKTT